MSQSVSFAGKLFETLDEAHGECLLGRSEVRQVVPDSLRHFDSKRCWLGNYVVMPNHVHLLVTPRDSYELEHILHSNRTWTSRNINLIADRSGKLWMADAYDRLTRDSEELLKTQAYIRAVATKQVGN